MNNQPQVYLLKKSYDDKYDYWETEVCVAETPDPDFDDAAPFVQKIALDELQAKLNVATAALQRIGTAHYTDEMGRTITWFARNALHELESML